jgi:hypothetical protein
MAHTLDRLVARYEHIEEPMHQSYTAWAQDQANRPNSSFTPVEYDPVKYPDQAISQPMTPAHDAYPWVPDSLFYSVLRYRVRRSIGRLSARGMLNELSNYPASADNPTPLPEALIAAQNNSENTVVITPHFKLAELGYFKALRFLAKKDRTRMDKNGVLMNKLMTRQQYRGMRLTDRFTNMGNIFWSAPKNSASAEKFGVPVEAQTGVNALLKAVLRKELEAGGLELDVAPTGSELREVRGDNGRLKAFSFPEIDPASAKLIKGFDNVLTASLIQHPDTKEWKMFLGELQSVEEMLEKDGSAEALLDNIFGRFQAQIEDYTRYETRYTKIAESAGKLALQ